jgi:citrate lyase subunit beta/citryl-CoA lyase
VEELFKLAEEVLEGKRSLEELSNYPEELKERKEVENPFRRAALIVSADRVNHLKKALQREADVIVFNLEDGVSDERKPFGRLLLRKFLANTPLTGEKEVVVRINPMDSPHFWEDITQILPALPHAVRLSKVSTPEEVVALDRLITAFEKSSGAPAGFVKIHLSIETPEAVLNLPEILKASERVEVAYLGILDLFAGLGVSQRLTGKRLGDFVREKFALECRACGVHPIGPAYQDYEDLEGFREEALKEKELGFSGKMAISVRQARIATEVFSPSPEEIEKAKRIVELYEKALKEGKGGITFNGKFIDQPIYRDALNTLRFSP